MKASELREKSIDELQKDEQDLRRELFNLRFQNATGEIQNPSRIRDARKDLARTITVITEKIIVAGKKDGI